MNKFLMLSFSFFTILSCSPNKKLKKIDNAFFTIDSLNSNIGYYEIPGNDYPSFWFFQKEDSIQAKGENELISKLVIVKLTQKDIKYLIPENNNIKDGKNIELQMIKKQIEEKQFFRNRDEDVKKYPYSNPEIKLARDTTLNGYKGIVGNISYNFKSKLNNKKHLVVHNEYYIIENSNIWRVVTVKTNLVEFNNYDKNFSNILASIKFKKDQPEQSTVTEAP
ncbi:hypothetical protein G7A72_04600 [Flavobacterium sp. Sr18]|jgi:hypothetical protein|uniref:hypothetical protein n=1 Tax=Flavobacterium sp. Sr18 TaxID=935222 RepID=UPI0013E46348|nr:hypothetical protein [Flavobacterium sp. Sr18]QIH38123.1 hypothetical protein G7A72_04600 [Flavobacterium sp. Sr18]